MNYRILGIDPGLTRCGFGVIETGSSRKVTLVDVGVLRTDPSDAIADRLTALDSQLGELIGRLSPDALAVEQVFAQHNVRTVTGTAQAAGVAMVSARRCGIIVQTHTPSEVKAAVTGHGRAPKEQVQEMVRRILNLTARPQPADAADALALAIAHAWRRGTTTNPAAPQTAAQRAWAQASAQAQRAAGRSAIGPRSR